MGAIVPVIINNIPSIVAAVGALVGLFKSHKNGQAIKQNHQEVMSALNVQAAQTQVPTPTPTPAPIIKK